MKQKFSKIQINSEKQKAETKIKNLFNSTDGRFWLLLFDIVLDWLFYKFFNIRSSGSILDGLNSECFQKNSKWKEVLTNILITLIILAISYFYVIKYTA